MVGGEAVSAAGFGNRRREDGVQSSRIKGPTASSIRLGEFSEVPSILLDSDPLWVHWGRITFDPTSYWRPEGRQVAVLLESASQPYMLDVQYYSSIEK